MHKIIGFLVVIISVATIFSGVTQMVATKFVLDAVGAESSDTAIHFFAIIGMFMAIFGALMLHVVYSPTFQPAAIFWCAMQKLGAFVAVALGIINELFGLIAGSVALFDLFSGLLFLYYLYLTRQQNET